MVGVIGLPAPVGEPPRGSAVRCSPATSVPRSEVGELQAEPRRFELAHAEVLAHVDVDVLLGHPVGAPSPDRRRRVRRRSCRPRRRHRCRRGSWSGRTSTRCRHACVVVRRSSRRAPGRRPRRWRCRGSDSWLDVDGPSVEVDRDDRLRTAGDRRADAARIDQRRVRFDVHGHRRGPGRAHGRHGRHRGERRHDRPRRRARCRALRGPAGWLRLRSTPRRPVRRRASSAASASNAVSSGPSSSDPDRITRLTASR